MKKFFRMVNRITAKQIYIPKILRSHVPTVETKSGTRLKTNEMNFGNIVVSTNEIHYPSNIICECGKQIEPTPKTIDSGTWNLLCSCGKIAYYHPKRHERQQQISDMLDL